MFKRFILAAAIAGAAFSAHAVQIRPLYTEHDTDKKAGALFVGNTDKVDKTYQVSVYEWSVQGGKFTKTKSTDLRFIPSIFTVKPNKLQTTRWVKTKPNTGKEQIYQVVVEEVPDPILMKKSGILELITVDFPWVWRPDGLAPALTARWDGSALVVKNTGTATAKLTDLVAGSVRKDGLVGYVMPGAESRFEVGGKAKVSVAVKVNGKDTTLEAK